MATWQLDQGSGDTWTVPAADADGNAIAYSGFETLSGKLWPGGGLPAAYSFTPVWFNPAQGLTKATIPGTTTATLAAQVYRVVCTLTDAAGAHDYYRGWLQVLADPAAVVAPPTYCSIDDLRDHAAWIEDLQAESDLSGFARQRGKARAWLDAVIVSRFRFASFGMQLGDPGWGAWSLGWQSGDPVPSKWIRDQLDANLLMVTDQVREITAKRALHHICKAQLGKAGEHSYQDLARGFVRDSEEMAKVYRAEIDLNADGFADVVINCGATSLR